MTDPAQADQEEADPGSDRDYAALGGGAAAVWEESSEAAATPQETGFTAPVDTGAGPVGADRADLDPEPGAIADRADLDTEPGAIAGRADLDPEPGPIGPTAELAAVASSASGPTSGAADAVAPHAGLAAVAAPANSPHSSPGTAVDESPEPASGGAPEPPPAVASSRNARPSRLQQLEREGEAAADFLERLLDIADLDGDIDVDIDGDRAAVAVVDSEEGRVPRRLVGPEGRVLEALQELTRLAVERVTGERSRLMLDVAGFRAQRRATLVDLAHAAIAEVQKSGQDKTLDDMTAFERKVVHDEVTEAGLVSQSHGAEPHRHIVISLP